MTRYAVTVSFSSDNEQTPMHVRGAVINAAVKAGALAVETHGPIQLKEDLEPPILAYSDGACGHLKTGELRPGGWGVRIEYPDGTIEETQGGDKATTNNKMELAGAIQAVIRLPVDRRAILFSDSQYVVRGLTEWLPNWIANHWHTSVGNPVLNREQWERLLKATQERPKLEIRWVKGHAQNKGNIRADQLELLGMRAHLKGESPPAVASGA